MRYLLLTLLVLAASLPELAWAGDGRLSWQTIETRNFRIHHPAPLRHLAQHAARHCEDAYEVLTPLLGYEPSQRVDVSISDYGDLANGSATGLPAPRMVLYAAPPRLDSTLGDYDNWLRLLIFHEFTHILQLDRVKGLPALVNALFGRSMSPNQNLPSFILEGGAVWAESHTSGRGRIHSALFRGFLRAQALAGRLHGLDAMTHVPGEWPDANIWYLYGGHFFHWLMETKGHEWLAAFHDDIADDLVPYGINRAMKRATGETFYGLYAKWVEFIRQRASDLEAHLTSQGLSPLVPLTTTGRGHTRPRFLPDGRLLSLDSGRERTAIRARSLSASADAPASEFFRERGLGDFDPCSRGNRLIYTRTLRTGGAYRYQDLFVWNRDTNRTRRLTRGARLREPACAPDGTWAVASQIGGGGSRLVRIDLSTGEVQMLLKGHPLDQHTFPVISPNGESVVFVRVKVTGERELMTLNLRDTSLRTLVGGKSLKLNPSFTPDGRHVLYSSDRDGILNLYAQSWPRGESYQVSRVLNGIVDGRVDPSGKTIAVRRIGPDGFDLARMPFRLGDVVSAPPTEPGRDFATAPTLIGSDYAPLEYLWPLNWSPSFAFSSATDASSLLGLEVETSDPLGHHTVVAQCSTLAEEKALSASFQYAYRRLAPTLSLGLNHTELTREDAAVYGVSRHPFREKMTLVSGGIQFPMQIGAWAASASTRYAYAATRPNENRDPVFDPLDPAPSFPEARESASLSISLSFGSTEQFYDSVSTEEGWAMNMSLRLRHPRIGGELESAETFFGARAYLPLWARHVLALKVNGAIGRSRQQRVTYGLGAPPERNIFFDALDEIIFGSTYLRGYPANTATGDRYILATAEYRMPVIHLFSGFATVPLFLKRLKLSVFSDWAQAANTPLVWEEDALLRSLGSELVTEATLGWRIPVSVRAGYAKGFKSEGEHQVYVYLGRWF